MGKRGAKSAQKEIVNIVQTSADVRPTDGIAGGSLLKETDTGNLYTFDESTSEWVLICTVSPSGGGGNPNRVQTITGTVENPWGDMTSEEVNQLLYKVKSGDATVYITVDLSILGFEPFTLGTDYNANEYRFIYSSVERETYFAGNITYDGLAELSGFYYLEENATEVTELTASAEFFPTTLTIIWHPLPT